MLGISSSCVNANSPYERGIQIEPSQTVFQSTHPVRGATGCLWVFWDRSFISTHAPRGGCDRNPADEREQKKGFQSTHPVGGCDLLLSDTLQQIIISIHAPRGGVRLGTSLYLCRERKFQSTHPSRGATRVTVRGYIDLHISIHAPLTGCDSVRRYV